MGKFFFLSILFILTCSTGFADEEKYIFHECKPFPYAFFDSVPFLLDFARWIAWFLEHFFRAVYFILNSVVITTCETISSIFSCLKYAIKFVEYLGCGVKTIFQLNYNVVSSIFDFIAKSARFTADSVCSFVEGVASGIVSVFQSLLSLFHGAVSSIPSGLYHASHGAVVAKNATGVLLYQSYLGWRYVFNTPTSAVLTIVTSIRAVMECLVVSIWNTGVLIVEICHSVFASIFTGIEFVGKTVQTCALSTWHNLVWFFNRLCHYLQAMLHTLGDLTLTVFHTLTGVIDLIFGNMLRGLRVGLKAMGWMLYMSLNKVISCFLEGVRSFPSLLAIGVHYFPGGKWSLISFVSSAFLIAYSWTVLRVNVFNVAFEFLESSLQSVLAFIATLQTPSFMQRPRHCTRSCNVPADEKDQDLMEQLERERDRNLCVVCQTEEKNIVVMPCRHMCMCKSCCTQLFRMQRYQRKTCPLCRHTITSTLEIYS